MSTDETTEERPTAAAPSAVHEMTLAQLRDHRDRLRDVEAQVSYWRRLVYARIDLIRMLGTSVVVAPLDQVVTALSDPETTQYRDGFTHVDTPQPLSDVADLDVVWEVPASDEDTAPLLARLDAVAASLSSRRAGLHARIDEATDELIRRYHDDPGSVLAER